MGRVSELVGVVTDGKLIKDREINGEVFYRITVQFLKTEIPVLFSSYINSREFEKGSKIRVIGCVMSDIIEGELPKFYFYATSIETEDIDAELTNTVKFSCTVTKVKNFTRNKRCEEILSLVAADKSPLDTASILYLNLKGSNARKLKDKTKGYVIRGEGCLKNYKDVLDICVTSVENIDKIT